MPPAARRLGGGGAATAQNIFGRWPMAEFEGGQGLIVALQGVWSCVSVNKTGTQQVKVWKE